MKHSRCCFMEQLLSEKILASAENDPKRRALRIPGFASLSFYSIIKKYQRSWDRA